MYGNWAEVGAWTPQAGHGGRDGTRKRHSADRPACGRNTGACVRGSTRGAASPRERGLAPRGTRGVRHLEWAENPKYQ